VILLAAVLEADAAGVRVRCEQRLNPPRSKASIDGFDLVPANGTFAARLASGLNTATSGTQAAVADQVEFDFDSDAGDIAEGATAIAPDFIQNAQVTGSILDAAGNTVATATAPCEVKR
jgi:hypothetical protein